MSDPHAVESEPYEGGNGVDEQETHPLEILQQFIEADNIADLLDDSELGLIGARAKREYEIDDNSRSDWKADYEAAMSLAMQKSEKKNYPWPNAANVKYPLLTTAAMQFAARAYPAIVPSGDAVKAKVIGKDEDGKKRKRGDRISHHMSWQLDVEMPEWEEDTDKLLHILPIAGLCYRKTYFDPLLGTNKSEMVHPLKLIVNDNAKSLETVPRITQELEFYPSEIEERFRSGVWRRIEFGKAQDAGADDDAAHVFLEQHRLLDLDDDGYFEPYIVTFHRETSQVVRIAVNFQVKDVALNEQGEIAQIKRDQYFTKYSFLPNPSGGFHDIGFGYLLRPIADAVNTAINQLLDAGHLANVGGGFIGSGARLRGGQFRFKPGEWKPVDVTGAKLRDNLVPLPTKEPSLVLFQLLGMLIDAAKDISSVKDVMTGGENTGKNASPTTVLALIEQGMQVFSAIYKRIFRALKSEYAKLYRLNGRYLDPETYFTVLDEQEQVGPEDYAEGDFDVVPVADPNMVTNMQRLARAEFLMLFKDDPHFDGLEIRRRMMAAASIEDVDDLMVEEPKPDAEVAAKADEMEIKKRKLEIEWYEVQSKATKRKAEILKLVAEAEAAEAGPQMEIYKQELAFLESVTQMEMQRVDRGAISSVEGAGGNQGVSGVPQGAA